MAENDQRPISSETVLEQAADETIVPPVTRTLSENQTSAANAIPLQDGALPHAGETVEAATEECPPRFPIVGIGASAGGLEALDDLFAHLPLDTGMAFVVVTHQHPGHVSLLPELLARMTKVPVISASDCLKLEPNHIYVGPPGGYLALLNGVLHRLETSSSESPKLPIDYFLHSLAEDQKENAICIILSGTASDGTLGLKAVKAESGMVMVQEPQSAKYAGMPASAIATGLVDYILTTAEMPKQLVEYAHGPFLRRLPASTEGLVLPNEPMQKILILLRSHTGHDFSSYKTNTLRRRIERRMNVHQIRDSSQYIHYLQENSHELDILFKELLISVTSFFRDPEAWELFIAGPLSTLLQALPDEYTIRAWVPGCASGEEVYTLAISLRECMEKLNRKFGVQIFGTDLDADAIDTARAGKYPDGIAKDVVPVRLERNFSRNENAYQISKEIRDMAVFAEQNVIRDPPFTKLDLLLCRNLLIYLNSDLQKRLFPIFHYALKPGGLLLLGPSETIGSYTDLFETVDKRWKSYRRKKTATGVHPLPDIPTKLVLKGSSVTTPGETGAGTGQDLHISRFVEKLLSGRFAPASVVVNDRGEVVYVHGRTGAYLELMPGQPNHSVLEMAREGLKVDLALALRQATTQDDSVVRENIRVKTNGSYTHINLSVSRIHEPESIRGLLLVTFTEIPSPTPLVLPVAVSPKADVTYPKEDKTSHVAELERELQYARESLQRAAEELETSSEELKSTNEELQSNNEELQSINEELETSKEEMQSLNEELTTVNAELQMKVNDLSQATDDMQNLLNNTDIGTIFLDNELNIKWFTEQAKKLIKLRQTDMGRPISDLASNLDDTDLLQDCQVVLKTLVFNEKEVQSKDGLWYLMRIIPYRTVDNLINGLVLTFVNIHRLKVAQANLGRMSKVFMAAPDPILIVDLTGKIIDMNEESVRAFGFARDLMIAQSIHKAILSESYEQMDALLARCAAGETIRDIDRVRVNKAADEEIPVLLTLVLLTDDQGQADSIAIMIRRAVR